VENIDPIHCFLVDFSLCLPGLLFRTRSRFWRRAFVWCESLPFRVFPFFLNKFTFVPLLPAVVVVCEWSFSESGLSRSRGHFRVLLCACHLHFRHLFCRQFSRGMFFRHFVICRRFRHRTARAKPSPATPAVLALLLPAGRLLTKRRLFPNKLFVIVTWWSHVANDKVAPLHCRLMKRFFAEKKRKHCKMYVFLSVTRLTMSAEAVSVRQRATRSLFASWGAVDNHVENDAIYK